MNEKQHLVTTIAEKHTADKEDLVLQERRHKFYLFLDRLAKAEKKSHRLATKIKTKLKKNVEMSEEELEQAEARLNELQNQCFVMARELALFSQNDPELVRQWMSNRRKLNTTSV